MEIEELKHEIHTLRLQIKKQSPELELQSIDQGYGSQSVEIAVPVQEELATVHQHSKVKEKLALYRSYFRGREDVYPIRWSGKEGKSGYSHACGNEWTAVCQKPKVKCSVCLHQNFLPVTDEILFKHLDAREGKTIGIYPMLQDETCWFLAMDFDKKNWQEDVVAVMQVCKIMTFPQLWSDRVPEMAVIFGFFSLSQSQLVGPEDSVVPY